MEKRPLIARWLSLGYVVFVNIVLHAPRKLILRVGPQNGAGWMMVEQMEHEGIWGDLVLPRDQILRVQNKVCFIL